VTRLTAHIARRHGIRPPAGRVPNRRCADVGTIGDREADTRDNDGARIAIVIRVIEDHRAVSSSYNA
jgi:hypothetical protein